MGKFLKCFTFDIKIIDMFSNIHFLQNLTCLHPGTLFTSDGSEQESIILMGGIAIGGVVRSPDHIAQCQQNNNCTCCG